MPSYSLVEYDNSGLQVVSPTPTGDGGIALNQNFQLLAYYRRVTAARDVIVPTVALSPISADRQWYSARGEA